MSSFIWWILVGMVGGWGAGFVLHQDTRLDLSDVIVGVIGAVVGGLALSLIGLSVSNLIGEIIAAFVGAVLVTLAYERFLRSR